MPLSEPVPTQVDMTQEDTTQKDLKEAMQKVLYGPPGFAVAARHPARNEQILVVSIAPDQTDDASDPLVFMPHRSGEEYIDIRVYRFYSAAAPHTPTLRAGDILPLSDGTCIGSIRHYLDPERTEEPEVRISMKPKGKNDLFVTVIETPSLRETYFLRLNSKEGERNA